jgi:two-component system cell cycle response regulator
MKVVPPPEENPDATSRFGVVSVALAPAAPEPTRDPDETFVAPRRRASDPGPEASLILIAHPLQQGLGTRYRLRSQSALVLGRAGSCEISMPDVTSLSRNHVRLTYRTETVVIEDLGSTNGTFVNDRRIEEPTPLRSGDRFQAGGAHFKFLQERDIENAYHQAIHDLVILDGMTQIANKRRFDEESERELGRARRYGRPLSLILFDVDRFKSVNDTYGHLGGDFVLKAIVELTRRLLRREQLFARVGGDEFALLTPEAPPESARLLAERVRSRIARHEFAHSGAAFRVTCSFGIASLGEDVATVRDLYEAADKALYRAKNAGRNGVFAAGDTGAAPAKSPDPSDPPAGS